MLQKIREKNLEIIKDIVNSCNYVDKHIDVYSVITIRFFELINSKLYKPIVDWNCIYETVFENIPKTSESEKIPSKEVEAIALKINEKLESLPTIVIFLLPLPKLKLGKSKIKINDHVGLIVLDEKLIKLYQPVSNDISAYTNFLNYFRNPALDMKEGDTFLKISTRGFAGKLLGFNTHGLDPIYVFKIFISLHLIYGNIIQKHANGIIKGSNLFVYSGQNQLLATPTAEGLWLTNRLVFNESKNSFESINYIFKQLINIKPSKTTKKLVAQIQNSLFWIFEAQNVDNQNLKSVFYVSAFDSFFDQDDKSAAKIDRIVAEISDTVQQEKLAYENLNDLYKTRNEIIHGERQLFDYLVESRAIREKDRARNDVAIANFYNRFIAKKIEKFNKSNKLVQNSKNNKK